MEEEEEWMLFKPSSFLQFSQRFQSKKTVSWSKFTAMISPLRKRLTQSAWTVAMLSSIVNTSHTDITDWEWPSGDKRHIYISTVAF